MRGSEHIDGSHDCAHAEVVGAKVLRFGHLRLYRHYIFGIRMVLGLSAVILAIWQVVGGQTNCYKRADKHKLKMHYTVNCVAAKP